MDEAQLQKAMKLIAYAGDSRSLSIRAMAKAEDEQIEEAEQLLTDAKKSLHEAHNIQTAWMSAEMNGEPVEKTILLIHSQDHFMAADIMLTVADKYIGMAKNLKALSNPNND
ncbi:PTS lactose/cellobiose transporter subunit IIA [Lacticaseibacillus pantheris]|jgi:PTS system cellobiose-specific IIA component|uniref:PTS lactose/cellobiose transporter subunit IIA n=1 Tax=Lacticaseibacillus pantheris TaxID=171523 RepID=UPI00265B44C2|nr:PTS lactose/cellobiose transporter subunit IIA [Lacticaseibacillus pantheris]WKF85234.1 PTS lactose/cellobiose transporter subunit IIA [Lacticaseibacillus pantheris]